MATDFAHFSTCSVWFSIEPAIAWALRLLWPSPQSDFGDPLIVWREDGPARLPESGFTGLQTADDVDGPVELEVSGCRLRALNAAIGLDTPALKEFSPPSVPSPGRDPEAFALPQQRHRLQQQLVYGASLKAAVASTFDRSQVRGHGGLDLLASL